MAATDMRSDGDDSGTGDALDGDRGHGHYFSKKTFHRPTYCHHCTDMLWGLIGQGYLCEGQLIYPSPPFTGLLTVRSPETISLWILNGLWQCFSMLGMFLIAC